MSDYCDPCGLTSILVHYRCDGNNPHTNLQKTSLLMTRNNELEKDMLGRGISRSLRRALAKYVNTMEKVKRRIGKIELSTNHETDTYDEWDDRVEHLAKELKTLLEILIYSCLGLKIPEMDDAGQKYRKTKASRLIKHATEENNPFLQHPLDPSPPFVVLDSTIDRNDCLTTEQWKTAWVWSNRFSHAKNPANPRPELTLEDLKREWKAGLRFVQRIINLLNTHSIVAKPPIEVYGRVRMAGVAGCPGVVMEVIVQKTPWLNKIAMNGGVASIQKKSKSGVWEDVTDGTAQISMHNTVGYCTKDGFVAL